MKPYFYTGNEYITNGTTSVLAYHNDYFVGKQGGIEIIHKDNRIATNGCLKLKRRGEENPVILAFKSRTYDSRTDTLTLLLESRSPCEPAIVKAVIKIYTTASRDFSVILERISGIDLNELDECRLEMELYHGIYRGSMCAARESCGILPFEYTGYDNTEIRILARGGSITLGANKPEIYSEFTGENCELKLIDGRGKETIGWFKLETINQTGLPFGFSFRGDDRAEWKKPAMIAYSRIGYHPKQQKKILIELPWERQEAPWVEMIKINSSGSRIVKQRIRAVKWGNYLRYSYWTADFTEISEEGVYELVCEEVRSDIFQIRTDIFARDVWQPTLETFIPVQMCHMRVVDKERIWHGLCHRDDAIQAPPDSNYFDGFSQTEEGLIKQPEVRIDNLNRGGWHDAGDDDINVGSNGHNIYGLALAFEEFGIPLDQTTVDFVNRKVTLHRPDGTPDALEQIRHGIEWILGHYEEGDHALAGVISNNLETYLSAGDWGQYTDNLFYDPQLAPGEIEKNRSGNKDDRYVFTDRDTRRDYHAAALCAISSRVLKETYPKLAETCGNRAISIWEREKERPAVFHKNPGTPDSLIEQKTSAAVELYLTTKDRHYLNEILNDESIFTEFSKTAWSLSRVIEVIEDKKFITRYNEKLLELKEFLDREFKSNPFGVVMRDQIWGIGWEIIWFLYKHYYLIKKYPGLFPGETLLNGVNYMMGCHPGSNLSLVSGVGHHIPVPAFGINRNHNSYIHGGVYSGPALIKPDFPELKKETPYIWQQSEYIISGAGPYIFCIRAAEYLLS